MLSLKGGPEAMMRLLLDEGVDPDEINFSKALAWKRPRYTWRLAVAMMLLSSY